MSPRRRSGAGIWFVIGLLCILWLRGTPGVAWWVVLYPIWLVLAVAAGTLAVAFKPQRREPRWTLYQKARGIV